MADVPSPTANNEKSVDTSGITDLAKQMAESTIELAEAQVEADLIMAPSKAENNISKKGVA